MVVVEVEGAILVLLVVNVYRMVLVVMLIVNDGCGGDGGDLWYLFA